MINLDTPHRPQGLAGLLALASSLVMAAGCVGVGTMGEPWAGELEGDGGVPEAEGAFRPVDDDVDPGEDPDGDAGPVDDEPADEGLLPDDPPDDPLDDLPDDPPGPVCSYPAGPYRFGVDQVVPAMSWASAVALGGEVTDADFATFHCDEEVRSVFVYVGNTT